MEDAVRALQQQVNALMSQNAALEAQLVSQQNIAQGLAELPGAITTVLSRSQAPMRRMLVDPKGLGKPPVFSCFSRFFCLPLVCAVSVLHNICLVAQVVQSVEKHTLGRRFCHIMLLCGL